MRKKKAADCADCAIPLRERACTVKRGKGGPGCPTLSAKKLVERARKEYKKKDMEEFARQASIQEGECYAGKDTLPYVMHPVKTRFEEICEFSKRMGYGRLGLLFCLGLAREAAVIAAMLKAKGFEVVSVACKAGAVPKEELGLKENEKIYVGEYESMCNPVLQALVVNEAKTDFNILLGLCVGHDSMVFKYVEAPTTVFAVKDRVLGHNPLACIYTSGNYYSWLGGAR